MIEAVVMGASAGALEALSAILPSLPATFAVPVIVVVHLPPDKKSILAELMQAKCGLPVREVEDKEEIKPGTVYFAPPDYHLLIEDKNTFALSSEEPCHFSRPSIDVLFESASDVYGERLLGIILTGANEDGAQGLKIIADAGGTTLVQQPESAYASAMPLAALAACDRAAAKSLADIAATLKQIEKL